MENVSDLGDNPALVEIVELGRDKGFVTEEDLLHVIPEPEKNLDLVEQAYDAIREAGLLYLEDDSIIEGPTDKELIDESQREKEEDPLGQVDALDSIGLYMKDVGRIPLLTAKQEVSLSKRIERGRKAREAMARGSASRKDRKQLRPIIEDGWAAREHLITANSRLVISVAKRYMGRGVPFLDLIQEGNIGLMRAAKKFDYRRGHKFSTYATWWIRQAVTRAIADQGRTIRVPVHMVEQINWMLRLQHGLTQELGRDPKPDELARKMTEQAKQKFEQKKKKGKTKKPQTYTTKKIEEIQQIARRPISLETPTGDEEDDSALIKFIKNKDADPSTDANHNLLKEQLRDVLHTLPPREVQVLKLRFGFLDGIPYTLEEVGRKMGFTRERARQIEAQALRRLRNPDVRRQLIDYLKE